MNENWEKNQRIAKILAGIFVILAGTLILLKQMGVDLPYWILLKWEMILIAVGIVMLVKHNFKKTSAYVIIAIGGIFLLNDLIPNIIETRLIWPMLIIFFGVSMIFKTGIFKKKQAIDMNANKKTFDNIPGDDFVKSSAFFGGVTKKVVSKKFAGASITSIFGGNEINLTQADFTGEANIDITTAFGGVTLIVPSNWKIKTDVTTIFGGIDDQRPSVMKDQISDEKTLNLKGTCLFGGIEIHSYN